MGNTHEAQTLKALQCLPDDCLREALLDISASLTDFKIGALHAADEIGQILPERVQEPEAISYHVDPKREKHTLFYRNSSDHHVGFFPEQYSIREVLKEYVHLPEGTVAAVKPANAFSHQEMRKNIKGLRLLNLERRTYLF